MNKKYKVLAKDTAIFFLGKFGSRMVLFFLVPLYTNFLTKSEYGTADLVFTFSQLLVPVFSIVIYDSLIRFGLMKGVKRENVLRNAFIVLGFGSLVTIVVTPLFSIHGGLAPWKLYLSAMIILAIAMDIEMNYLKVCNKNLSFSIISIIQSAILAGSNILLLTKLSLGIQGYLLSTIVSYMCCVVLAYFAGNVHRDLKKSEYDKELMKKMLLFSAPLILNSVSWWVIQSSDKFMLEAMLSAAALGLYTAASKIPSLINVVVTVFQQAWGISSIKEIESTNNSSFYSGVLKVYGTGVFACCILLNLVVKPFMSIYVGKEFTEAWRYVPLLVASAGFSAISAYYGALYSALKKSVNNMVTTLVAAIVNVIVNFVFILTCGIWGAMIGTVSSYVLISYLRMIDISRYIKMNSSVIRFVVNTIIVLTQAVLVSMDLHIYAGSIISLIIFCVVNHDVILLMLRRKNKVKG